MKGNVSKIVSDKGAASEQYIDATVGTALKNSKEAKEIAIGAESFAMYYTDEAERRLDEKKAGEKILSGGEIFNDYENNKAISKYSHASGSNTHAGHYAFSFKEHEYTEADYDTTNNIGKYYLNTVEGITVGLNYTIVLNNNFGYQGVVNSVGEDYIEVTNYLVPNSDSTKTLYYDSSYIIFPDKPAIQGDMLIGYAANSEGYNTNAMGKSSHAEGGSTIASGKYSHAEGRGSKAGGYASHAETSGQALGHGSHAESLSIAKGEYSHGEGRSSAIGNQSHAEGQNTVAEGANSHAEGFNTYAQGYASHTEGRGTKAQGYASHAEGYNTSALGENAHAEGSYTNATSSTSHAEGQNCLAAGKASHAEGLFAKAHGEAQHVQGRYNIEDTENKYAHIVGNGTSVTGEDGKEIRTLSNAHTLDWEGNAWFAGDVVAGDVSVQDLQNRIDELESQLEEALNNIISIQNELMGVSE